VSKNSIKFHYPKEEMEFGRIGDIEYIDVGFELPIPVFPIKYI
jgi:hypothetical protein